MCKSAGIKGKKSNHSLCTTGLCQAGIPEKIIKERTGHHSLESLQKYEHAFNDQHKVVANILAAAAEKDASFSAQMTKLQSTNEQTNVSDSSTPSMNFREWNWSYWILFSILLPLAIFAIHIPCKF